MRKLWLIPLLCLPLLALAADFELNKDYKLVATPQPPTTVGKVEVVEFFSYGCPACSMVEPTLQTWLITKPKNVVFDRVPAIFHPEWYPLAKAFFVAKNLNIANRITPSLFNAVHKNHQDISSKEALAVFFQKQGVSLDKFAGNYDFSPSIEGQIARGDALMRQYGIVQIPTFVVNGLYQTSLSLTKGDPHRLMQVINFLIKQAQTPVAKTSAPTPPTATKK